MLMILAPEGQRQEECKFEASLGLHSENHSQIKKEKKTTFNENVPG
jgi:hypothetical protein